MVYFNKVLGVNMSSAQYDLVLPGTGGRYLILMAAARRFAKIAEKEGLELRNIYTASGGVFGAVHTAACYEDPREWIEAHWGKTKKFKLGGWRVFQQIYNLFRHKGVFRWESVRKTLSDSHPHKNLNTPVWVVVWDMSRNRELYLPVHEWPNNNIGEAMAVSCSLPIMISPPRLRVRDFPQSVQADMLEDCGPNDYITLMDGCLSSDTPADIAGALGFEPVPVVALSLDNFGGYDRDVGKGNIIDHITSIVTATMEANRQEDADPGNEMKLYTLHIDSSGFEKQTFRFNLDKRTSLRMIDRGVREVNRRVRECPWLFDAIKGFIE
jgi:predicted acylesterase/phospholipase RssA